MGSGRSANMKGNHIHGERGSRQEEVLWGERTRSKECGGPLGSSRDDEKKVFAQAERGFPK